MIIKENKHRNIEHIFVNTSVVKLFFEQQDVDEWQNVQNY